MASDVGECGRCKSKGRTSTWVEVVEGLYECKGCGSSISSLKGLDKQLLYHATKAVEKNFPSVRWHGSIDLGTPSLSQLLDDCHFSLVCGRYGTAIILMGVLLEAILKERIRLQTNENVTRGLGPVLSVAVAKKLISSHEEKYLKEFKTEIRNRWNHHDIDGITKGGAMAGISIDVAQEQKPGENMIDAIDRVQEELKSGKRKMAMMSVADHPALRDPLKMAAEEQLVFRLYDDMLTFVDQFSAKYLKQSQYDAWRAKYGPKSAKTV